jgi:hypothetical protein
MISHALTIVLNEMRRHFGDAYGVLNPSGQIGLGNIAEGIASNGSGGVPREMLIMSVVNIREEKTLKNLPNYVRDETTMRATYENPPIFLNFMVLLSATHGSYENALLVLSRALRFFQSRHVFTQDSVAPSSITEHSPMSVLDQLTEFKLILDLYSPSMEEVNHLWGTLGAKQYPFALFNMRMLELKFRAAYHESSLITEIVTDFQHKNGGDT